MNKHLTLSTAVASFIKEESGAAMPEYSLLLGLIAAVAVATMTSMGSNINTIFTNVDSKLATAASR